MTHRKSQITKQLPFFPEARYFLPARSAGRWILTSRKEVSGYGDLASRSQFRNRLACHPGNLAGVAGLWANPGDGALQCLITDSQTDGSGHIHGSFTKANGGG